jgi:drug/metabolite transporter (DMT)-like permease
MEQIKKKNLSLILLLILGLIWGSSFLFIKLSVDTISPITAVLLRMSVATICIIFYLIYIKKKIPFKNLNVKDYLIIAIFGNVLPFILVSWAEIKVNTNLTGIIMGLMPLTTVLLAYFFVKNERITIHTFLGVILGFLGLFFLLEIKNNLNNNLLSELAIVLATFSFATATVYARRIQKFQPLFVLSGSTFFAFLILLPLSFLFENPLSLDPSNQSLFFAFVLGILNTAIGGLIFFKLIKLSGASFTSTVNFLTPFVAIIWGYIFLNETLNINQLIGLFFIILGISLVHRSANI